MSEDDDDDNRTIRLDPMEADTFLERPHPPTIRRSTVSIDEWNARVGPCEKPFEREGSPTWSDITTTTNTTNSSTVSTVREFPLSEETLIGMFMAGAGIDPDSVKNVRRDWLPPGYY